MTCLIAPPSSEQALVVAAAGRAGAAFAAVAATPTVDQAEREDAAGQRGERCAGACFQGSWYAHIEDVSAA